MLDTRIRTLINLNSRRVSSLKEKVSLPILFRCFNQHLQHYLYNNNPVKFYKWGLGRVVDRLFPIDRRGPMLHREGTQTPIKFGKNSIYTLENNDILVLSTLYTK